MNETSPVVVCVIGMHRSGTSLLARLLNFAGVELGAASSLARAATDNPRGFWEHEGLRKINDDLLLAFGGSWMTPPELPDGWTQDSRVAPLRERAQALLAREFDGRALWGFKDPRTTLLTEFWREVLPGRIAWIVAVRNPLEVADSLKRRDGFPSVLSEDLWNSYTRTALLKTVEAERALVHFERLLAEPAAEVERLIRALRLPAGPVGPEAAARMREEAARDLRHHSHGLDEIRGSQELRPDTCELYLQLWNGEDVGQLEAQPEVGFGRAFKDLLTDFARLKNEQDLMRTALTDRELQAEEALREVARTQREATEWRDEALMLRSEVGLLKTRTEYRLGERLRRVWRRLRGRAPQS
jgi:hypothetical protein